MCVPNPILAQIRLRLEGMGFGDSKSEIEASGRLQAICTLRFVWSSSLSSKLLRIWGMKIWCLPARSMTSSFLKLAAARLLLKLFAFYCASLPPLVPEPPLWSSNSAPLAQTPHAQTVAVQNCRIWSKLGASTGVTPQKRPTPRISQVQWDGKISWYMYRWFLFCVVEFVEMHALARRNWILRYLYFSKYPVISLWVRWMKLF